MPATATIGSCSLWLATPTTPSIRAVADKVIDRLERSGRQVYSRSEQLRSKHPLQNIITALLGVLGLLGVLVLFLSSTLITNTLLGAHGQQTRQVGIMKLVGGRRSQIERVYLLLVGAYAITALALAVPVGAWVANRILRLAAEIINCPLSNPSPLALSAPALALQATPRVPLLSALQPIRQGTRISVRRALSSDAFAAIGATVAPGHAAWIAQPGSRACCSSLCATRFRQSDGLQPRWRHSFRVERSLSACSMPRQRWNGKVESIGRYFGADVNLDLAQLYRTTRVSAEALAVPGVEAIEAWSSAEAGLLDERGNLIATLSVLGPPADSALVEPGRNNGRWLRADDRAALTVNEAFLRRYPNLDVGSTVRLDIAGAREDWTTGVFEFTGMDELVAYANQSYLARVLGQSGQSALYRVVTRAHDLASQRAVAAALDAHLSDRGLRVANAEAGLSFVESTTNTWAS